MASALNNSAYVSPLSKARLKEFFSQNKNGTVEGWGYWKRVCQDLETERELNRAINHVVDDFVQEKRSESKKNGKSAVSNHNTSTIVDQKQVNDFRKFLDKYKHI